MKNLITSVVLIIIGLFSIKAQTGSIPDYEVFMRELGSSKVRVSESTATYKGSPYLFAVEDASIIRSDKEVVKDLKIRYNAYEDQVEIDKDGQYYIVPKEDIFSELKLGDKILELKAYTSTAKKKTGYFVTEIKGKLTLYSQYRVILNEPEEPGAFKDAKPAEFIKKQPKAFIACENGDLMSIKNKNDFLELAPDHQKELGSFIKTNKIKFKKLESIRLLVDYYNSLNNK
ncbi:hypothetical protein J1N10_08085 [Carboxylicivirga sp. A043]|uniref:hypothetical protein n=1 Tax=Carboxylicivirga litoralis TaxID=2816963 RepID=UPI0021CB16C7|nr:hypothetical protein [Carboxylicivirga sp. A043]MCU4155932.1 hypothetical protein [Carboxylicivirga sp. A043]